MRQLRPAVTSLWRSYATQTMGRPVTKIPIPGVDHIIAVASGKGGVGKSTTAGQHRHPLSPACMQLTSAPVPLIFTLASGFAVNIAVALSGLNSSDGQKLKVGLLDADVYGPSIPQLMKLHGRPETGKGTGPASHLMLRQHSPTICYLSGCSVILSTSLLSIVSIPTCG